MKKAAALILASLIASTLFAKGNSYPYERDISKLNPIKKDKSGNYYIDTRYANSFKNPFTSNNQKGGK